MTQPKTSKPAIPSITARIRSAPTGMTSPSCGSEIRSRARALRAVEAEIRVTVRRDATAVRQYARAAGLRQCERDDRADACAHEDQKAYEGYG